MEIVRWYIGVGRPGAMRYLLDALPSGEILWTEDRAAAHRYDRREDAAMMALHVAHADPALTVLTLSDDKRARQQAEGISDMQADRDRRAFEVALAAIPDHDRRRWLLNEGDDGGSLWWHRALVDATGAELI